MKDTSSPDKDDTILNIYCDGSAFFNGKPNCKAGFAVFFGVGDRRNYSQQILDFPSNNRAELHAILKSLEIITSNKDVSKYKKIVIHSDSEYSIKSATLWIKGWKKNGWMTKADKPVEHKDLLQKIDKHLETYQHISLNWVPAHTNQDDPHSIGNDHADKMAINSIKDN